MGLVFIHKLLKLILPPSNNICTSSPGHANQCVCKITEMPLQISAPIHPPVTRPTTPLPRALAQLSVSLAAAGASTPPPGRRGRPGRVPPLTSGVASVFRADEDELFPPALPWLSPAGAEPLRQAPVALPWQSGRGSIGRS